MSLTKKQTKKLSLEVWGYLKYHPEARTKLSLPEKLYIKIQGMRNQCPLCEYYAGLCYDCILKYCTDNDNDGLYDKWVDAKNNRARVKYATLIYDKIKGL